jgi:hypothetical protein
MKIEYQDPLVQNLTTEQMQVGAKCSRIQV